MSEAKGLRALLNTLENVVGDLTSLEVYTYTGDVSTVLTKKDGSAVSIFDWKKVTPDSEVKLVAATRIDFDQDRTTFHAADATDQEVELFKMHDSAVADAITARQNMLDFFKLEIDKLITG